jgi:uncharacterized repeat protein (TIGR01451 family)
MRIRQTWPAGLAATAIAALLAGVTPAGASAPTYMPYELYPLGAFAETAVVADVNADGRGDVVVSTSGGLTTDGFQLVVFTQQADGSLGAPVRYPTIAGEYDRYAMGLAAGDVSGDGIDDVALATQAGVEIFYGRPGGLVARDAFVNSGPARYVEIADLDGGGPSELVVSGRDGVTAYFRELGGSGFIPVTATLEVQNEIEVADVTGDGFADIVGFYGHTVSVYRQIRGDGFALPMRYEGVSEPNWWGGNGLAVGDLNDDGLNDVALSNSGTSGTLVNLFVQTPTGTLSGPTLYETIGIPHPLEIGDLDGDGRDDLVAASVGIPHVGVWSLGHGFRETAYEVPYVDYYQPKALALGDVNGDGIGDVVLADPANGLVVLRSTEPPPPDTVAPQTSILSGPAGTVASTSATFEFGADEQSSFECSLDAGPFAPCASPVTYASLAEGGHGFQVRATDWAGNTDPTPAAQMWTVDSRAPETTITGGPSGTVTSTSATFAFAADEAATFTCALDGAAQAPCTSPATYAGLGDGAHQFTVRATDGVGNTDPTPAMRSFTVQRPSDLRVAMTATPQPVKFRSQLTYRATVTNAGPADNTGVALTVTVPAGTTLVSVTPSTGTCTTAVSCSVGPLANGASATVTVVVKVDAKKGVSLTATAQASGVRVDPNPADNSASVTAMVA